MKRRPEASAPTKRRRAQPTPPPAGPSTAGLWPFVQLPWLLVRELSHGQALAYAAILRRAGGGPGECWATWKTIGEDVGKSRSWARSRGYELRRLGLISIETRATEEGDCDSNRVRCAVFVRAGELVDLRGGYVSNQTHPPVSGTRQGYAQDQTHPVPESRHRVCLDPGTERESPERESPERDTHTAGARAATAGPADEPGRVCVDHGVAAAGEEAPGPASASSPAPASELAELLRLAELLELPEAEARRAAADLGAPVALDALAAAVQHDERAGARNRPALARSALAGRWKPSTSAARAEGTRNRPSWRENTFDRIADEIAEARTATESIDIDVDDGPPPAEDLAELPECPDEADEQALSLSLAAADEPPPSDIAPPFAEDPPARAALPAPADNCAAEFCRDGWHHSEEPAPGTHPAAWRCPSARR